MQFGIYFVLIQYAMSYLSHCHEQWMHSQQKQAVLSTWSTYFHLSVMSECPFHILYITVIANKLHGFCSITTICITRSTLGRLSGSFYALQGCRGLYIQRLNNFLLFNFDRILKIKSILRFKPL